MRKKQGAARQAIDRDRELVDKIRSLIAAKADEVSVVAVTDLGSIAAAVETVARANAVIDDRERYANEKGLN